ncbi:MAG: hypothetical protein IJ618_09340 [Prevotella sp.]|nr:hypothetical protein [Prevotella sp.]
MKLKNIAILSLVLLLPLSMSAQKKKKRAAKKRPAVEEPQEDPRITSMREMTQQIIIIDSIVTDKEQIMAHLRISSEAGMLTTTSNFLGKETPGNAFVNEMGNKAYFSMPDDSLRQQLFTSDLLGGEWSRPQSLQGLGEGITEASYPFMLADGITFYFAAKGEESIGGYDIFFTRYDSRNSSFFKAENIGMPFNSEANDYMYAIDEYNKIGYFVSDRQQPEGKVCIYIFIPAESRQTYDVAAYTEQQLRNLAAIRHIADTWGDGKERKAALARWKAISKQQTISTDTKDPATLLVINDALTYGSTKEFRSQDAAGLYSQLVSARHQLATLNSQMDKLRILYQNAAKADRKSLNSEILQGEADILKLNNHIKSLEKQARNAELKVIN